jgi:pimeloyl-ACP methyl ester carboxylesterase
MTIEPFRIAVPDPVLEDLQRRLDATIWPHTLDDAGWDYGTDLATLRALVEHWRHRFDWRARERELNAFPHYRVRIGEALVHCIWARAQGGGPPRMPLVLTHGWPSTFYELTGVVEPLTRAGFDVVVPSLPGYGFSSPPTRRGFGASQVADLWIELMAKLGYERFGSHGGDWGSAVTTALGARHPDKLIGLHVNMLAPPVDPEKLSSEDRAWWQGVLDYRDREWGYVHLQRTKPQTASFALTDSPVGLAAWLLEKWWRWSDIEDAAGRRDLARRYSNDQILTTIMLYWVTRSIGPSMRMYFETFSRGNQIPQPARIEVPLGVAAFRESNRVPRALAEPHYNVVRWEVIDDGGHFPGLENPTRLAHEIATFFGSLAGVAGRG